MSGFVALTLVNAGKAQQLVRKMSESEVRNVSDETLLLRGESVPTRLLSVYLRREGKEYSQRLICSLHRRIANAKPNVRPHLPSGSTHGTHHEPLPTEHRRHAPSGARVPR